MVCETVTKRQFRFAVEKETILETNFFFKEL